MKTGLKVLLIVVGVIVLVGMSLAGAFNNLVALDEKVSQAWSQVENVYQRRADLIPNLVETVKGYAAHEKSTLQGITDARARIGGTISSDMLTDPQKFQAFQQAQSGLSSALSRLLVVSENYPALKADQNFIALQAQLEGTENRVSVERGRFNEAAQMFNTRIRSFPSNIIGGMFGFKAKEYFKSDVGAAQAPKVQF